MPWIRVAIIAGGCALVTGAAGMVAWIDNGSHYFELAVALASAGFLTLVACVLTRVFGSSHGSQDDAFRRGRAMGYDAGYVEGHRTARPVVVPLRGVDRDVDPDLAVPFNDVDHVDIDHVDELKTPPNAMALWRRERMPLTRRSARERVVGWVVSSRIPLLAGALSLAVVGALVANALASTPGSAVALPLPPGRQIDQAVQPGATPALVSKPDRPGWSVAVKGSLTLVVPGVGGVTPVVPDVGGVSPVVPDVPGVSPAVPAAGATAVLPVAAWSSQPGVAVVARSAVYSPPATGPVSAPSAPPAPAVVPVLAAPAVALTPAQQTAADALAAANLTRANALSAANLTAANAAASAAETARVAAAAAEATRLQALADAYAVAHPGG